MENLILDGKHRLPCKNNMDKTYCSFNFEGFCGTSNWRKKDFELTFSAKENVCAVPHHCFYRIMMKP